MNQIKSTTPVSFVGKHTFTAEEKDQRLQQMLAAMRQKEEIEAEFKTTKSNYKSKIDAKDAEIKLSSNLLNAGFEDRTFSCYLVKNFDTLKREFYEIGTNVLVGTEPLTAADHQMELQVAEDAIKANNEQSVAELFEAGPEPEIVKNPADNFIVPEETNDIVEPTQTKEGGIVEEAPSEPEEIPFWDDEPIADDDDSDPFNFNV